jgi:RNA polymerase sigma-70 factor (ECF subfamily)
VLNEAYGRLRQRRTTVDVESIDDAPGERGCVVKFPIRSCSEDPAAATSRGQIRGLLEQAIDELPEPFRIVFVMREIEQCTIEETASNLDIRAETVKTRLHRARRLLRKALQESLAATLAGTFPFLGRRCERMTMTVLERLQRSQSTQLRSNCQDEQTPDPPFH